MNDCLIVGGGVIGLSLAYVLADAGVGVHVIDAGTPGREASWAGAGILPPANENSADPIERLTGLSNLLHAEWSDLLRDETGIDNGFRRCGGIYLARESADCAELSGQIARWREQKIAVELLSKAQLPLHQPRLRPSPPAEVACLLPDECQLRNPRHLQALLVACRQRNVRITGDEPVERFVVRRGRVMEIHTRSGKMSAGNVCLTAGCWSGELRAAIGNRSGDPAGARADRALGQRSAAAHACDQ